MRASRSKRRVEIRRGMRAALKAAKQLGYQLERGDSSFMRMSDLCLSVEKSWRSAPSPRLWTLAHEVGHCLFRHQGGLDIVVEAGFDGFCKDDIRQYEEVRAWEIGEQFVPRWARNLYWSYAKKCLRTYGVELER